MRKPLASENGQRPDMPIAFSKLVPVVFVALAITGCAKSHPARPPEFSDAELDEVRDSFVCIEGNEQRQRNVVTVGVWGIRPLRDGVSVDLWIRTGSADPEKQSRRIADAFQYGVDNPSSVIRMFGPAQREVAMLPATLVAKDFGGAAFSLTPVSYATGTIVARPRVFACHSGTLTICLQPLLVRVESPLPAGSYTVELLPGFAKLLPVGTNVVPTATVQVLLRENR